MQHLEDLSSTLQPLGLSSLVEQHVLFPGHRRTQLVQAMLTRLLGGKGVDEVRLAGADQQYDGLPEDERFARQCQAVLQLLGISATPEQLRGCSGQQDRDTAALLQMAQLLVAMEAQRAGSQQPLQAAAQPLPDSDGPQVDAATAGVSRVTQLLAAAAAQLSRLLSENVQLFPSDMADTLKAYSDQGALVQLPQLCQQAVQRAQQLQQALQQLMAAGADSCEGAGSEQWLRLVQDVSQALERQLQEMQAFDAVYQQELSVWAGPGSSQQQRQQQVLDQPPQQAAVHAGRNGSTYSAEATGSMARSVMVAYKELHSLLDAVTTIMVQHQALKDVPSLALQQQRDRHLQEKYNFQMSASAVRSQQAAGTQHAGGRLP